MTCSLRVFPSSIHALMHKNGHEFILRITLLKKIINDIHIFSPKIDIHEFNPT